MAISTVRLSCSELDKTGDHKRAPLWWHLKGLTQTATGYGSKLTTEHMVRYKGKWRRVYCCCWSNSGTCYIEDGPKRPGTHRDWIVVED
jgi:hypothetical protein